MSTNNELKPEDLVKYISDESLKMLQALNNKSGGISLDTLTAFIYHTINTIVYNLLKSQEKKATSNEQKFKDTKDLYFTFRTQLQEAVGLAFTEAMTNFSGKDVEYVCEIQVMPAAKNKLPC